MFNNIPIIATCTVSENKEENQGNRGRKNVISF